ncbi:MAG: formylmethanofuran dehydrogenase [Dethiosulfovibrio peptidovorans]|nr:MAG: formylmethanofuran dehydrogenase [Dethiosulfovibrio peptidovorans]
MLDRENYDRIAAFHGHTCPGLAIGVRVSELALEYLGCGDGDEELVCITETDMCAVDAVQFMTNCTLGKGNLVLHHYGKVAFTFYRRRDGVGFRCILKSGLKGNMDRDAYESYILTAPLEKLFNVAPPKEPLPPKAYREKTLICHRCGEGTMESMTRNLDDQILCLPCFQESRIPR